MIFGFKEAVEFCQQSDDPRLQAIGRMLVDQKNRMARQHERIRTLETCTMYVVCNNDAMLSATDDEELAKREVTLATEKTNAQFPAGEEWRNVNYFHIHEVPRL